MWQEWTGLEGSTKPEIPIASSSAATLPCTFNMKYSTVLLLGLVFIDFQRLSTPWNGALKAKGLSSTLQDWTHHVTPHAILSKVLLTPSYLHYAHPTPRHDPCSQRRQGVHQWELSTWLRCCDLRTRVTPDAKSEQNLNKGWGCMYTIWITARMITIWIVAIMFTIWLMAMMYTLYNMNHNKVTFNNLNQWVMARKDVCNLNHGDKVQNLSHSNNNK